MTPQEFVHKWKKATLSERSAAQQHFLDICNLVGHPTPADIDSTGESFTFEKGTDKTTGKKGFADVWKRGYFGWEYKGNHANLDKAYQQLLTYRESLENPPLLVVSDMDRIVVHTNFTNTLKRIEEITYDDLLTPDGMKDLKAIFNEPNHFKSERTTEGVTAEAAKQFALLSERLRNDGAEPHEAAHFLIRLLFCLFAEDVGLLPAETLKRLVEVSGRNPEQFSEYLQRLFGTMATGGSFGFDKIPYFNGSLFDDDAVLALDRESIDIVESVSRMDWGQIEPSIFGTLFERSLDPAKRSQLGAHYTSKEDILLIVEPVLMKPLRDKWDEVQTKAEKILKRREEADSTQKKNNQQKKLRELLLKFSDEISEVTVLDPACGSGNFLYVSLRQLLDLQKEVIQYAGNAGLPSFFPSVTPRQLHGIEINPYAHELASATIWIGYIQWLRDNGFGFPPEPILQRLDTIENRDALLEFDDEGNAREAEWQASDVIVGNPPFLGVKKLESELGTRYTKDLYLTFEGSVSPFSDLVCYWFHKAGILATQSTSRRVGLIATNSIRQAGNRHVLDHIQKNTPIFWAISDRPWTINGAQVRVSMVAFSHASNTQPLLDGIPTDQINSDLTGSIDITSALRLAENIDIVYQGVKKVGPFDIGHALAETLLSDSGNPNGRPNSDVVRRTMNGRDMMQRSRDKYTIDFGATRSMEEASEYYAPFEYVKNHVKPYREQSRSAKRSPKWWLHLWPRPEMREALVNRHRYIATPSVAKHRVFSWLPADVLPDAALVVIARDDDYFLGVLHSSIHTVWTMRTCSWMGAGNDPVYTPNTTFLTFPFPWPPGEEPTDSPIVQAIAEAAKALVDKRDRWLNPEGATEKELKKRTLTNLYNERPTWLDLAHRRLDEAVLDAYEWPHDIGEEEILEKLLALNLERAGKEQEVKNG